MFRLELSHPVHGAAAVQVLKRSTVLSDTSAAFQRASRETRRDSTWGTIQATPENNQKPQQEVVRNAEWRIYQRCFHQAGSDCFSPLLSKSSATESVAKVFYYFSYERSHCRVQFTSGFSHGNHLTLGSFTRSPAKSLEVPLLSTTGWESLDLDQPLDAAP